jgi:hypothetical protein
LLVLAFCALNANAQGPRTCFYMYPCTVLVSQTCADYGLTPTLLCTQPRGFCLPAAGSTPSSCSVDGSEEVIKVNTNFFGYTHANSGASKVCLVPNETIVCWKVRPCTMCLLLYDVYGDPTTQCVPDSNDVFTNFGTYANIEEEGSCNSGGGGGPVE